MKATHIEIDRAAFKFAQFCAFLFSAGVVLSFIISLFAIGICPESYGIGYGGERGKFEEQELPGPRRTVELDTVAVTIEKADVVAVITGPGAFVSQAEFAVVDLVGEISRLGKRVFLAPQTCASPFPGSSRAYFTYHAPEGVSVVSQAKMNNEIESVDLLLVVGASDTVNPYAFERNSPIYGLPVYKAWLAKETIVLKRSPYGDGYSGIANPLLHEPSTAILAGDILRNSRDLAEALAGLRGD